MMHNRSTVLIICFTDLASDPRVYRQISALASDHRVVAAGLVDPGIDGVEFLPLKWERKRGWARAASAATLLARRFDWYYWLNPSIRNAAKQLVNVRPDAVIANDIDTLPLALRVARRAPVIFDSHEYSPGQFEDTLFSRLVYRPYRLHQCRRYIPRAAAMLTVGEAIAEAFRRDTGVLPDVMPNAPAYEELTPSKVNDVIELVHHGAAVRDRRLETMLDMVEHLEERFRLTLMLAEWSPGYLAELKTHAAGNPRIEFVPPVSLHDIPQVLNRFDVGVYCLPPRSFNQRYALPNKLFEFVQARLAIAIGPSPEMRRVVERYGLGVVGSSFAPRAMANAINALSTEDIAAFKARSDQAARGLSADSNVRALRHLVGRLLDGSMNGTPSDSNGGSHALAADALDLTRSKSSG